VYNDKHHFGREYILKDLNNIYIWNKIREVDKYFKIYYFYSINYIDNQLSVNSFQPISISFQSIYTIFLNFVVELSIVSSKDTLWAIDGFDIFNSFFTNIYKASKRKLLILDNKRYSTENWGYILKRQLLLNDWNCLKAIILNCDSKFISDF